MGHAIILFLTLSSALKIISNPARRMPVTGKDIAVGFDRVRTHVIWPTRCVVFLACQLFVVSGLPNVCSFWPVKFVLFGLPGLFFGLSYVRVFWPARTSVFWLARCVCLVIGLPYLYFWPAKFALVLACQECRPSCSSSSCTTSGDPL